MSGAVRWVDGRLAHTERDPTAAELAAWLQARAELAVEVVGLLRVAGPWEEWPDGDKRPGWACHAAEAYDDGSWCADGDGSTDEDEPPTTTLAEARAAADAALVAAGWSLAGGGT